MSPVVIWCLFCVAVLGEGHVTQAHGVSVYKDYIFNRIDGKGHGSPLAASPAGGSTSQSRSSNGDSLNIIDHTRDQDHGEEERSINKYKKYLLDQLKDPKERTKNINIDGPDTISRLLEAEEEKGFDEDYKDYMLTQLNEADEEKRNINKYKNYLLGQFGNPDEEKRNINQYKNYMLGQMKDPEKEKRNINQYKSYMLGHLSDPVKEKKNINWYKNYMLRKLNDETEEKRNINLYKNHMLGHLSPEEEKRNINRYKNYMIGHLDNPEGGKRGINRYKDFYLRNIPFPSDADINKVKNWKTIPELVAVKSTPRSPDVISNLRGHLSRRPLYRYGKRGLSMWAWALSNGKSAQFPEPRKQHRWVAGPVINRPRSITTSFVATMGKRQTADDDVIGDEITADEFDQRHQDGSN